MKVFKELYKIVSNEKSNVLIDTSVQLCEYVDSHIPESEEDSFMETILAITDKRQEYFFRKGFEIAIELLLNTHEE